MIVLMNPEDRHGARLEEARQVTLVTDCDTRVYREVQGLAVTLFDLPRGCLAGYFRQLNPLIPLGHLDVLSKTPAAKVVPVRIEVNGRGAVLRTAAGHLSNPSPHRKIRKVRGGGHRRDREPGTSRLAAHLLVTTSNRRTP
jgi:hypothetical protein